MKSTLILVLLLLVSPIMAADHTSDAVMPLFTFGETGASLSTCFAIGNGQYLLTTADNVMENIGTSTKHNIQSAVAISPWTGDIYRARIDKVDGSANLALLKLDKPGLPAAAFAKSPSTIPFATLGQLLNENETAGGRWPTIMYSYLRGKKDGRTSYLLTQWNGTNAFITEAKGRRWLFLKDVKPQDKAPGGGPVVRDGEGVVGIYISRFIIEGGGKSDEQRLCVPLTETLKFLESAGLKKDDLYNPSEPTFEKADDAEIAFQFAWRAVSNVIGANWENALTDAKTFAEARPKSAEAQLLNGLALAGAGKTEEAVKSFDAAVKLDTQLADAYLSRGIAQGVLGKKKESEQDLRKVMELNPNDIHGPMWLSRLLSSDENKRDEAVQLAEQAVKISPYSPMALLNLGSTLALKGNHERAISELKHALEIAPNYGDARAALASEYRASGKTDEAEKEYRVLVKAEPKNPAALLELAGFLAEQGKKDEAKQLISQALELNPSEALKNAAEELKKKTE